MITYTVLRAFRGKTLNQSIKALTQVHVSYIVYQTNHFGTSPIKSKQISYINFWNKPFLWTELHIKWKLFIRMLIKQLMLIFRYHQSYNTTGQADKLNTKSKNLMIIHVYYIVWTS